MTYEKSEQIVDRKVRDERILVPIGGHVDELKALFTLNPVAAFIWDQAIAGHTVPEIGAEVARHFDIDETTATTDTRAILRQFVELGALRKQEGSP